MVTLGQAQGPEVSWCDPGISLNLFTTAKVHIPILTTGPLGFSRSHHIYNSSFFFVQRRIYIFLSSAWRSAHMSAFIWRERDNPSQRRLVKPM